MERLAGIADDSTILQNSALKEFGCNVTQVQLRGLSDSERQAVLQRFVHECPQVNEKLQQGTSLLQTTGSGSITALDPLSWVLIITAGLMVAFFAVGGTMMYNFEK